tara:strand:- start:1835 stop:2281 length:447 start_codon:yes stop_codon:yes gene_type:complete
MSVVPAIYSGLKGTRSLNAIANIPTFGSTNNGLSKPSLKLNWKTTKPIENGTPLRQSVLLTNMGGTRGVMPCKGAASVGGVWGVQRVLRRPAIPQEGGMYPQVGFARGQRKGLAFQIEKPINLPLMPHADSFNAGLNSTLGQLSYTNY